MNDEDVIQISQDELTKLKQKIYQLEQKSEMLETENIVLRNKLRRFNVEIL